MELSAKQQQAKIVAGLFVFVTALLVISMAATILLIRQNEALRLNKPTHLIPIKTDSAFTVSEVGGDANYLKMIAVSFLHLRFNVTPETVSGRHRDLLTYVAAEARPDLSAVFEDEARRVKEDEISSAFYETGFTIDPVQGLIDVRGHLHYHVGNRPLTPDRKHYQLELKFTNGVASIVQFLEVNDEK